MQRTIWKTLGVLAILSCVLGVLATTSQAQSVGTEGEKAAVIGRDAPPSQAQSETSCPPCSFYESEIAADKASLSQLEQKLAEEMEWMNALKNTGKVLTDRLLSLSEEKPEDMTDAQWQASMKDIRAGLKDLDESAREVQQIMASLTQAIEGLRKTIQGLEAEYTACRRDQCRPKAPESLKGIGMAVGKGPDWASFQASGHYFVEGGCPECDALRRKLRDLEAGKAPLEAAVAEAQRKVADAEEVQYAVWKDIGRQVNERGHPAQTAEEFATLERWKKDEEIAKQKVERSHWDLARALDKLGDQRDNILATQMAIEDCQRQSCAPAGKTTPAVTAPSPGSGWYFGLMLGGMQFPHPKSAVAETAELISPPPGSDVSTSTDTSGAVGGIDFGYQAILRAARTANLFGCIGISGFTVPNFTGTYRIDTTSSDGMPIGAEIQYDFMTDQVIAPYVALRVRAKRGPYFDIGAVYYSVPMKLRTTEKHFVNGSLVDSSVMEEKIHDSAFGYQAGFGWMAPRWGVGVSGRRAKINNANLDIVTADVRWRF